MASYRKLKSGWKVTISQRDENGKLRQTSKQGFATKLEARRYAATIEQDIDGVKKAKQDVLFLDYYDQWVDTYKRPKAQASTMRKYYAVHNLIKDNFDGVKIQDVTRTSYQRFLNAIGQRYAKGSMLLFTSAIKECMRSAIADDIIAKDFTQQTEMVYGYQRRSVEYLTIAEIKKLARTIEQNLTPRHPIPYVIYTAIYTGMRLGEITALEWSDIDFDKRTISINKTWSSVTRKAKSPKTESSNRVIVVNRRLLDVLLQLKDNGHDMIFKTLHGMPVSRSVNASLRSFLKKAGIDKPSYHFHGLRHSHVAYLLSKGVDLYAISKRLGHKDMTITAKTYAYLIDEYKEKQDRQIVKAIDEI
ncbi:integrase [Ligilactobacillus ruminis DPC 6832]|uniref:Integrase n=1 Tax=Ligilactobacillus ruminis DPC 6832 TaxID=1402208 RepID=A0A837DVP0_9LACO|nr:tyrosine-type recombinase/integrase [Ligilactobacillus ruminis]KIC04433.1 integrase [Ligilactobacillus ruminis DPC 6832]